MSWERWRPEIAKAVNGDFHSIEDIEQQMATGRLLPWFADECCLLLKLVQYPAGPVCQVMWAAGTLPAIFEQSNAVEAWARSRGCVSMLVESSPAMCRALGAIGYKSWSATVRKAL